MVRQVINGKVVLTADAGKRLVRNGISVTQVTLGVLDSELNWTEKDEAELTLNEEIPAEEALKIITGGGGNDDQG